MEFRLVRQIFKFGVHFHFAIRNLQASSGIMQDSCLNFSNPITDSISRIRFASASNNLLISSWDSILRLYDVDKRELVLEAPSEGDALLDCCFESDSVAFSADSDGFISRYDLLTGDKNVIGNHEDVATCTEYSEETRQLISAGWDRKLMLWDSRSDTFASLVNMEEVVGSITVSGFNLIIALKSSVHSYDLRFLDGSLQAEEPKIGIYVKCVRSWPNLEGYMVGSVDGRVALHYLARSNLKNEGYAFRCHPREKNGKRHLAAVNDIAFDPSMRGVFVTGDNDGHVIAWDTLSRKRLEELPKYPSSVASLAYNHSGKLLAVASSPTYQDADERDELPQIFLHRMDCICRSRTTDSRGSERSLYHLESV